MSPRSAESPPSSSEAPWPRIAQRGLPTSSPTRPSALRRLRFRGGRSPQGPARPLGLHGERRRRRRHAARQSRRVQARPVAPAPPARRHQGRHARRAVRHHLQQPDLPVPDRRRKSFYPDGEVAVARAAKARGTLQILVHRRPRPASKTSTRPSAARSGISSTRRAPGTPAKKSCGAWKPRGAR